ncbi:hypothetical protein Bca52824_068772 [Brassica carinata]|uniref:Uncharacterized protein n=1 Tax=Brassica carinata TaxID=52824 RepID=A0A8X7Q4D6_BRACI|nr:hypothetical protein Bca52824_068772 [Brassica carinata]
MSGNLYAKRAWLRIVASGGCLFETVQGQTKCLGDYIRSSLANRRADGCMNVLVERYDTTLKQTMVELGASTKLAKTRLGVIERLRAESKRVSEKTLEEKEILRVKFEDLEAKLAADRAAKKELEKVRTALEKENTRLRAERNAAVEAGRGEETFEGFAQLGSHPGKGEGPIGHDRQVWSLRQPSTRLSRSSCRIRERAEPSCGRRASEEDLALSPRAPQSVLSEEFLSGTFDPYGSSDALLDLRRLPCRGDLRRSQADRRASLARPGCVVSHVNAPDPILVSEVAEKDRVEIEVPPAGRGTALTEELAGCSCVGVEVESRGCSCRWRSGPFVWEALVDRCCCARFGGFSYFAVFRGTANMPACSVNFIELIGRGMQTCQRVTVMSKSSGPAAVVSHVNAPDPILVSEVAEKDTGVEIEVPPAEREEPALTEELASDAAAVDVRSGVPEDAAAVGAQDPSVSGEALV